MASPPVVAIAGASGNLGIHIATAIHAECQRGNVKEVVILARLGSKQPVQISDWQKAGTVTLRTYTEDSNVEELRGVLHDVDVLVNAIGSAGYKFRDKLLQAIASSTIHLYLPSEFGVDHTMHDFGHPEWDHKKDHIKLAQTLLPSAKLCRIYAGLFLEDSIGPWFGFDTERSVYTCFGSRDTPITFTALEYVGKAVAQVVQMPLGQIPAQLHLAGDTKSIAQIAEIMSGQSGAQIEIVEMELRTSREHELEHQRPDPSGCLRFLMGEGRINHSGDAMGNDNNLVNPREDRWKWRSLQDEARATGGRPWMSTEWK